MSKKIKTYGFTLIELLVVIAIIGVLASIVLVSLGGARAKASASKAKSDLSQIMTALELYQSDNVNLGNIAIASVAGETCASAVADGDGSIDTPAGGGANEVDTTEYFAVGGADGDDLCLGNSITSDGDAPVISTLYLQDIPTPPATYTYQWGGVPSATSYNVEAIGFTDGGGAETFNCTNGSCNCSAANQCQR